MEALSRMSLSFALMNWTKKAEPVPTMTMSKWKKSTTLYPSELIAAYIESLCPSNTPSLVKRARNTVRPNLNVQ